MYSTTEGQNSIAGYDTNLLPVYYNRYPTYRLKIDVMISFENLETTRMCVVVYNCVRCVQFNALSLTVYVWHLL